MCWGSKKKRNVERGINMTIQIEITEEQLAELGYVKTDLEAKFSICTKHSWGSRGKAVCPQCSPPKPEFGRVKPKSGDQVYLVDGFGTVCCRVWDEDNPSQRSAWNLGNIYLTREAAELAIARQQAKVRVIDKLAELKDHDLDWGDDDQVKHTLLIDSEESVLASGGWWYNQFSEKEFYSTKSAVEWVAENMADDVKLMLTGVE